MNLIKIGVICPSEIAFRRFMPALLKCDGIEYVGIAHASADEWFGESQNIDKKILESDLAKAKEFQNVYGGKIFGSYTDLITSDEIDAIYLPLPPALHYKWAKAALESGKHVLIEKPSTISENDTNELVSLANEKSLALHENYMFVFHNQIKEIKDIIKSGILGDIRLYRISFGFPKRPDGDFRYSKFLGGGALLDCGGYTIKLAHELLGDSLHLAYSKLNTVDGYDVDIYGSGAFVNNNGVTAQFSFGMDNSYKCDLEIWGSKGQLFTGRILTAPDGFVPQAEIKIGNETEIKQLSPDDTFKKSIQHFCSCVHNNNIRLSTYKKIIKQAELVEQVRGKK